MSTTPMWSLVTSGRFMTAICWRIDALARLGLTARRLGCALELWGASDTLVELIAFVGFQQILSTRDP